MKKIIFSFLLVIISLKASAQDIIIQAGVPYNQIWGGFYSYVDTACFNHPPVDTAFSVILIVDPNLIPILPGFNWYLIIDSLTIPPNHAFTSQTGALSQGDSLLFTSANPTYNLYFDTIGYFSTTVNLIGTTFTLGQSYICDLDFVEGFTSCFFLKIISPNDTSQLCTVGNFNSIKENSNNPTYNVFYNQFSESINIKFNNKINEPLNFCLYDLRGQKILSKKIFSEDEKISTCQLPFGLYMWQINDDKKIFNGKILLLKY